MILLAAVFAAALLPVAAQAVEISLVRHEALQFDPREGEAARIRFRLSRPAAAALHLYDGRDLRIRSVELGDLAAGDHVATWDGKDERGRLVPPEAYTYAMEAISEPGERTSWDLGASTGGERLTVHGVRWDPATGVVHYRIDEPARVRIRIGLANNGPLLRTLIDWVPRTPGAHTESWDGRDAAGVLDLRAHPHLRLSVSAFSLPRNSLLVGPPPHRVHLIEDVAHDVPRRERPPPLRRRMFDYARQPIETRRDFPIRLVPVGDVDTTANGDPIVKGSLPLRLAVEDEQLGTILAERCEAVFFVDGQHVFEREIGFLPMTWTWTPTATAPGTHHITANIRGYDGHFGMTTLRVVLAGDESDD